MRKVGRQAGCRGETPAAAPSRPRLHARRLPWGPVWLEKDVVYGWWGRHVTGLVRDMKPDSETYYRILDGTSGPYYSLLLQAPPTTTPPLPTQAVHVPVDGLAGRQVCRLRLMYRPAHRVGGEPGKGKMKKRRK